ncbi:hypothetical protein L0337_40880 [candidate division KSB1 bacterium]|nr:hypothetical protein [candidate division KSB1 bacterium]
MNRISILPPNETASKYLHYEVAVGDAKEEIKPDFYGFARDAIGLPAVLWASLASSILFRYDLGMEWKQENATTISSDKDFQATASTKKRIISAKEAGRLALLNLEKAEARRRKYVEDLARIQPDFKE